ncbi:MAG: DUF4350 domain-containing protein [Pseudomonas sp.]|nr:DUF4350 domain-containing protein [Pseudomonas sp.]
MIKSILQRYLLVIIAGLLLIALGIWLSQKITFYEERIELGASPEARSDRYLAIQYFLREQGIAVTSIDSLVSLMRAPAPQHTLFLLSNDATLIDSQQSALLDWVAQGGHLVISAQHEKVEQDAPSLLATLGIEKHLSADLDEDIASDEATLEQAESHTTQSQEDTKAESLPSTLTRLYLENEQSPAYLALDSRYHLYDADNRAHAWANSQAATHLLQLTHGQGLVTVLSDFGLWQQTQIKNYDHAWLLWYLAQDTEVTLFNPPKQQGLFSLLWQYFPIACGLLLVLLLLSVWANALRFGPIITPQDNRRRKLTEHLHAAALFNLRYNGQRSLLLALQKDIQQRAQQRYPSFSRLAVSEQWQVLQQLSRQPISLISHSMRPPLAKKLSTQAFTLHVTRLQQLRNAL